MLPRLSIVEALCVQDLCGWLFKCFEELVPAQHRAGGAGTEARHGWLIGVGLGAVRGGGGASVLGPCGHRTETPSLCLWGPAPLLTPRICAPLSLHGAGSLGVKQLVIQDAAEISLAPDHLSLKQHDFEIKMGSFSNSSRHPS